ncbi:MAG: CdvA-like protein [Ignisphaera sp.]
MSITIENVASNIGQTITDVYGRKIGVLVSVYSDFDGKVTAVEIMTNDMIYETLPADRLEHGIDGLKVLPEWLIEAKKVERKLDVIKKRFKAMEELYKKNQIAVHAYKELREKFTKEIERVKIEAKNVKEMLRKRISDLENFVIHIEKAMTHLMVSYTAGEIPENGFKVSADFMRFARQAAIDERKDLDKHIGLIEKLEQDLTSIVSGFEEQQTIVTPAQSTPTQASATPIAVKVVS